MSESLESRFRRVMDGSDRSAGASLLRGASAWFEPIYALYMRGRNRLIIGHPLGRPTISVGNITTGGTGKTPVVQWLTGCLAATGRKPAVLMRGYKSTHGVSDEQIVLAGALGENVAVIANPDRLRGAAEAIRSHPQVDLFILDDGMQHRRAARDFELALIHAADPFGLGRVFPRGFLREPLSGLARVDAFLITHACEVKSERLEQIEKTLRQYNPTAPIFRADHVITGVQEIVGAKPFFAFCGIGSPESFFSQLAGQGNCVGRRAFADHHVYTAGDLADLNRAGQAVGAAALVTTEKDWAKLSRLPPTAGLPIVRAGLVIRFWADHEEKLLERIGQRIG
jgi:tetraacyldisaccharide 4'-kinase